MQSEVCDTPTPVLMVSAKLMLSSGPGMPFAWCTAAVDKFLPDTAMQEAFRINEVSRLRLADLPATRQFVSHCDPTNSAAGVAAAFKGMAVRCG